MALNRAGLEKRIAASERVLLDTSVLIAYLSDAALEATHDAAVHLIDELILSSRNAAIVSPVTAMELLVQPLRTAPAKAAHVHGFLTHTPNLSLVSIDIHVAQEAAALRAVHRFKTPDAMIIATGIVAQVHHLVTNDEQWKTKLEPIRERIRVTTLRDYA